MGEIATRDIQHRRRTMTEELETAKVSRERLLEWIDAAVLVGRWPASLDNNEGKFLETADELKALVERSNLRITVVHKVAEAGPGDNHRPAGEEPWLDAACRMKR
jgi:hypothetical protein